MKFGILELGICGTWDLGFLGFGVDSFLFVTFESPEQDKNVTFESLEQDVLKTPVFETPVSSVRPTETSSGLFFVRDVLHIPSGNTSTPKTF